jgi:superfamily II DNA/RNA helicase
MEFHKTKKGLRDETLSTAHILVCTPYSAWCFLKEVIGVEKPSSSSVGPSTKASSTLGSLQYLVFDEVDVLLDKSFVKESLSVAAAVRRVSPSATLAFFTATLSSSVNEMITNDVIDNPHNTVRVVVGVQFGFYTYVY